MWPKGDRGHLMRWLLNRVEKSLCHIATVAKFLGHNKPKASLNKKCTKSLLHV